MYVTLNLIVIKEIHKQEKKKRLLHLEHLPITRGFRLVMEQPGALLDKRNAQFLGRLEDRAVVLASAGRGDVLGAGAGGTEDVVDEGELREST